MNTKIQRQLELERREQRLKELEAKGSALRKFILQKEIEKEDQHRQDIEVEDEPPRRSPTIQKEVASKPKSPQAQSVIKVLMFSQKDKQKPKAKPEKLEVLSARDQILECKSASKLSPVLSY